MRFRGEKKKKEKIDVMIVVCCEIICSQLHMIFNNLNKNILKKTPKKETSIKKKAVVDADCAGLFFWDKVRFYRFI